MSDTTNNWAVFRQDFSGNEFVVERNLSQGTASALVAKFESHKHHQHYWAVAIPDQVVDYAAMLNECTAAGSSVQNAISVIQIQGANPTACINAIVAVQQISLAAAKKIFNKIASLH